MSVSFSKWLLDYRQMGGYTPLRERDYRADKESFLSIEQQRITELKLISDDKSRQRTMNYIQQRYAIFCLQH